MEIIFNTNNSFSIVDDGGKIIFQQNLQNFNESELEQFGFASSELNKIKLILKNRKYNFYS